MNYNVDVVICIDTTSNFWLSVIKKNYDSLFNSISNTFASCNKHVDLMRVKLITFSDTECNKLIINESRFYEISKKTSLEPEYYIAFVKQITCTHRISRSNGLEALALAIQSDWVQTGDRRRHIIVMFTDAPAHKLEEANTSNPNYPADMPTSLAELGDLWNNTPADGNQVSRTKLKQSAKRLIIFAPQEYPWPEIYENWEHVTYNYYNPLAMEEFADGNKSDFIWNDMIEAMVGTV